MHHPIEVFFFVWPTGGKRITQDFTDNIPLQRLGESRDIADAAVFLASSASSYITGTVMIVDGGSYLTSGVSMARMSKMISKLWWSHLVCFVD